MLCSHNTLATYTILDNALEYDAIIDAQYTEKVSLAPSKTVQTRIQGLQDYSTKYF